MDLRSLLIPFLLLPLSLFAQDKEPVSIHQLESAAHSDFWGRESQFFDSINSFRPVEKGGTEASPLIRRVFGYQPYWGGSNYLNYQWNLVSDLCHFSYEVDPVTGFPVTVHNWETSPAIDSAFANGVRVHLCVTLFSGHSIFFQNPEARQNLIDQVILLISDRGAHGVNMDVEALPSSQKEAFMEFMTDLCNQMEADLPGAEVSIAAPAVNWNEKFNIPALNEIIDFFMVMGYDYYWGGSAFAGPVSPLYPMTGTYNYSFSRTISYYQSEGVPTDKLIMGVPYYAYQWQTEGPAAPSATIGTGSAYTYRYVMDNNSGFYSYENKHTEPNSFGPYYSFESNGWNQCFLDDPYSLGEKYDIVNRRNLGGIGIWALGYDNGHSELWDLIAARFTVDQACVNADTLYDSGGPAFDYYDDEAYTSTLTTAPGSTIYLAFTYLDTEENYDTLWIHDGADAGAPLLGFFTGNGSPGLIQSSANLLTLRFHSDGATTDAGWRAVYDTLPVSSVPGKETTSGLLIRPNPGAGPVLIEWPDQAGPQIDRLLIINMQYGVREEIRVSPGSTDLVLQTSGWGPGLYLLRLCSADRNVYQGKLIVK